MCIVLAPMSSYDYLYLRMLLVLLLLLFFITVLRLIKMMR